MEPELQVPNEYLECLRKEFGHETFRKVQWNIIRSILEDRKDNCAILVTGYGKSLIYQFPAMYTKKIAIVVSPLISLMQDQVSALNLTRERACFLGMAQAEKNIEKRILNLEFNLIYVTPEKITSETGLGLLRSLEENLVLIAIDEAHCISQWGHDFRPAFRRLNTLRDSVRSVPILAVTATATQKVIDDVCSQLKLRSPLITKSGFDRPNLQLIVRQKKTSLNQEAIRSDLVPYITPVLRGSGSIIVYCNTCKNAETVCELLALPTCRYYHSNLSAKLRSEYHQQFSRDEVRIIVATMAFGMGIDKPDVRLVIHYGMPNDLERYYQEIGRAGRDGLPAKCVLFYSSADWETNKRLRETKTSTLLRAHLENLAVKMVEYTRLATCRRRYILEYFGDRDAAAALKTHSNCCDNCRRISNNVDFAKLYDGLDEDGKLDVTQDAERLLSLMKDLNGRFGFGKLLLILRGSNSKELPAQYRKHTMFGKGSSKPEAWYKIIFRHLQTMGYVASISKSNASSSYSVVETTAKANTWLACSANMRERIRIEPYDEILKFLKPKTQGVCKAGSLSLESRNAASDAAQDSVKMELIRALLRLRTQLSSELNVMPYIIASNAALEIVAERRPKTMEELKACKLDGFYEAKYERFGERILQCLKCLEKTGKENAEPDVAAESRKRSYWDLDANTEDMELAEIGDNVERELANNDSKSGDALDMLLLDLDRLKKEVAQTDLKKDLAKAWEKKKKPAEIEYIDSDSSSNDSVDHVDEVHSVQEVISSRHDPDSESKNMQTSAKKKRVLPSWMGK